MFLPFYKGGEVELFLHFIWQEGEWCVCVSAFVVFFTNNTHGEVNIKVILFVEPFGRYLSIFITHNSYVSRFAQPGGE